MGDEGGMSIPLPILVAGSNPTEVPFCSLYLLLWLSLHVVPPLRGIADLGSLDHSLVLSSLLLLLGSFTGMILLLLLLLGLSLLRALLVLLLCPVGGGGRLSLHCLDLLLDGDVLLLESLSTSVWREKERLDAVQEAQEARFLHSGTPTLVKRDCHHPPS